VSGSRLQRQPTSYGRWTFFPDALIDGGRLRALTVVDALTREALTIEVDQGIRASRWWRR